MTEKIFDTHAHYDSEGFDADRDAVLAGLWEAGVGTVVNIGAEYEDLPKTLELMEKYPFVYGALGVHPDNVGDMTEEKLSWIRQQILSQPKVLAVGEIGLDYYWDTSPHDVQKHWFCRQMDLARECKKPIVIHSREAAKDTFDVMKAEKAHEIGGIMHCFSYGVELARETLNMGYYLGVGGVLTFQNARKLREVVEYAPMDRIVLETDCPYLTPVPFRGKRNDSTKLSYVVERMAQIKGISEEEVIRITAENAHRVYRMEDTASV